MALLVGILYGSTLLPGLDLGDTASFQVMAGARVITPRDAYPLYFCIGRVFAWVVPGEPAFALNVASAVEGALAAGLVVLLAHELSGSLVAATASALFFAGSYTFWSQSVIAEVYALHMCLVAGTMLLVLRWARHPTWLRLTLFFALYAVGFGNHLSMILLAPAYACFLLLCGPAGWRSMLSPRVVALALACAALGALQYLWNFRALWLMPTPPAGIIDGLETFWFDVTKSDWRHTMVLRIPSSAFSERLSMYLFDLVQQFGRTGPVLALVGAAATAWRSPRRALLVLAVYVVNVAFAFGYNVGDAHVFFLPSHLMVALLIAPGVVALDRAFGSRVVVPLAACVWSVWGIYDNYPALDRSRDTRGVRALTALTAGVDAEHGVLLSDLNWQIENGLGYVAKETRPALAHVRLSDVLLYAPALIRDNAAIGRSVFLTGRAQSQLQAAYGPLFTPQSDPSYVAPRLSEVVQQLPAGTRYVLCALREDREFAVDQADLRRTLSYLTGGRLDLVSTSDYAALIGTVGHEPIRFESGPRPFHTSALLDGVRVDVRMESWLAFDTIRRMGFGQVVANRHHALVVERGISFAALDASGQSTHSAYSGNVFETQPRYVIRAP